MEHLWFMNCIILSYSSVWIFSQFEIFKRNMCNNVFCFFFFISFVLIEFVTVLFGFPEYFGICTMLYILFFYRGKDFYSWIINQNSFIASFAFLSVNIISFLFYNYFHLVDYKLLKAFIDLFSALTLIGFISNVLTNMKRNAIIAFISSISFEMYLIHHPFVSGYYSFYNDFNPFIATLFVFSTCILGGLLLHNIGKVTYSKLLKIYMV